MKTTLLFTFLIFFMTANLSAQIEKGTWLLGGDASVGYSFNDNASGFNFGLNNSLSPSAYFVNNRLAIGATPILGLYKYNDDDLIANYGIGPFLRYYFNPAGSLKWFAGLNSAIAWNSEFDPSFFFDAGFGFNYFLNASVAIEAKASMLNSGDFDNFDIGSSTFPVQLGLQFFLSPESRNNVKSTSASLTKGMLLIGGTNARLAFEDEAFSIGLQSNIGYFVLNQLVIGANLPISFYTSDGINATYLSFAPLIRYYFSDTGKTLWFAEGSAGIQYRRNKVNDQDFLNDASAFLGGATIGINHFLTPNVAIEAGAVLQYEGLDEVWRTGVDIGLQFLIGAKDKE